MMKKHLSRKRNVSAGALESLPTTIQFMSQPVRKAGGWNILLLAILIASLNIPLKAQNSEAPKSASVGRAAKELASSLFIHYEPPPLPKGRDWTLERGHTWLDCLDGLTFLLPNDPDWAYMRESIIRDFMQMPDWKP